MQSFITVQLFVTLVVVTLLQYFTLCCDKFLTTFSRTSFSTCQPNSSTARGFFHKDIEHDNSTLPSSCSVILSPLKEFHIAPYINHRESVIVVKKK